MPCGKSVRRVRKLAGLPAAAALQRCVLFLWVSLSVRSSRDEARALGSSHQGPAPRAAAVRCGLETDALGQVSRSLPPGCMFPGAVAQMAGSGACSSDSSPLGSPPRVRDVLLLQGRAAEGRGRSSRAPPPSWAQHRPGGGRTVSPRQRSSNSGVTGRPPQAGDRVPGLRLRSQVGGREGPALSPCEPQVEVSGQASSRHGPGLFGGKSHPVRVAHMGRRSPRAHAHQTELALEGARGPTCF